MIISRKEYETMKAVIDSLNWTITHKNNEIARLKAEIARNDRDIRALHYALSGEDIDFPGKGGNADNTGMEDINDILDL